MTIGTGDVVRASAILKRDGVDDIVNVFHLRPVLIAAETQLALRGDIADYLEDVYGSINTHISGAVSYDVIELFNVTDNTPEPSVNWPALTVGASGGDRLPDGVTALTLGRTGVSRVIGKKYWPHFTVAAIASGLFIATVMTSVGVAAADYIAPFTGASLVTWDPGVHSRLSGLFRVFTEAASTNVPAYQRRRKRGVGS